MKDYKWTLEKLQEKAVLFWPDELREQVANDSILPLLLKTQSKFLSVLEMSDSGPEAWKYFVEVSGAMPANLFLKHLMTLSGVNGEMISQLLPLSRFFPDGIMHYTWNKRSHVYRFAALANKEVITDEELRTNYDALREGSPRTPVMEDATMLLLHGSTSDMQNAPDSIRQRCLIGRYMAQSYLLERYIRPIYMLHTEAYVSYKWGGE